MYKDRLGHELIIDFFMGKPFESLVSSWPKSRDFGFNPKLICLDLSQINVLVYRSF